jgi:hypothetical protein
MTEDNMTDFRREGEPAFGTESENENSEDSSTEENDTEDKSEDDDQDNDQSDDDKKPLNKNPRWQEREQEWNDRFSTQELQHKKDMEELRAEISANNTARKENADQTNIPTWFGGTKEQWDSYRADRDAELAQAEERAAEKISKAKKAEDEAVKEATDFMKSELEAITADKSLNPTGGKIDPNKLLKIVMDNDIVDSKGRWNYKAGMRIYNSTRTIQNPSDKKIIAAVVNSESKGESKAPNFKTSTDFKKPGARPW